MDDKVPATPEKVVEYFQKAASTQERLELSGMVGQAAMLRARRNALARAAGMRPERSSRYRAHLAVVSANIKTTDDRVLERAMVIKSRPRSCEGFSLIGRTLDERGTAKTGMTVAVLGPKEEVLAWTVSDIGGWYSLAVEGVEGAAYIQVSDERGTVIDREPLKDVSPGVSLQRTFTVPRVKEKGSGPQKSSKETAKGEKPPGDIREAWKDSEALRAALIKARDASEANVEMRATALKDLNERIAALKASQAEAERMNRKIRGQERRGRTALQKIETDMAVQQSGSAAYDTLIKQRGDRAEKQAEIERERAKISADKNTLDAERKKLLAERKAAEQALAEAKRELAVAESDLAALK